MEFVHHVDKISDSSVQNLKNECENEITSGSDTESSIYLKKISQYHLSEGHLKILLRP